MHLIKHTALYWWCSPGLYSRTPAFFRQSQPHFIEQAHLVSQCLLCYKVNDDTIKCFMQGTVKSSQNIHFSKAVDSMQHKIFWHSYSTSMVYFSFLNIANTLFCVSFEFSRNINNSGIRNKHKSKWISSILGVQFDYNILDDCASSTTR